ncbi:hypothetical protein JCGZ_17467 [Jatropha curcas]|uniref:Uncharacterized protein n=1 Tax=Jatropha curcas TaxID=180498 RepID=A0A067LK99_JATCU|nr:hypothetical protein JCGZ_17467 [Jatropha curcas]
MKQNTIGTPQPVSRSTAVSGTRRDKPKRQKDARTKPCRRARPCALACPSRAEEHARVSHAPDFQRDARPSPCYVARPCALSTRLLEDCTARRHAQSHARARTRQTYREVHAPGRVAQHARARMYMTSREVHALDRVTLHARARLKLAIQRTARPGPCHLARPVIGAPAEATDEDIPAATDIEEDQPPPFPGFTSSAGTSGAGPSFQGPSTDELFTRMFSRMDMFDTRLTGMESTITDRFQSLEITQGSIDSRLDTLQSHYQGLATQLQTVIQLLQPPPPPPEA